MKTIEVNGKMIKTNYGGNYSFAKFDGNSTMSWNSKKWILREGSKYQSQETEEEMLERLVDSGYTTITFYKTTTSIRGFYEVGAYCK